MRGIYSGYKIYFTDGIHGYKLITRDGVRSIGIDVEVTRKLEGTYEVYLQGKKIEVTEVYRAVQVWEKIV